MSDPARSAVEASLLPESFFVARPTVSYLLPFSSSLLRPATAFPGYFALCGERPGLCPGPTALEGRRTFYLALRARPEAPTPGPHNKKTPPPQERRPYSHYFAYSTTLVSRITCTFICPGYSNSLSIFFARSLARTTIWSSLTASGRTITRTSRPA